MAKQKLGQHFLINKNIILKIADSIPVSDLPVIEIGPGRGALTRIVSEVKKRKLIAIEKDPLLYEQLKRVGLQGVELLNKSILDIDIKNISEGGNVSLLGNLPYYISKEIIDWTIKNSSYIENGVLMVQKEFFDKINSSPRTKLYNAQSIIFRHIFDVKKLFDVKPGSFVPPPKVTSTVLSFERTDPISEQKEVLELYSMLKTAFLHRRKTLINNLEKDYSKDNIKKFLETKTLPPNIRAEDMTRENLKELYYFIIN